MNRSFLDADEHGLARIRALRPMVHKYRFSHPRLSAFIRVKNLSCKLVALCGLAIGGQAAAADTIAIVHAQAWTMTGASGGRIDDATIVIRDGHYDSVQAGAAAPAGARVIDAAG